MKTLWDTRPQRIHENTRRSWRELDTGTRQRQICQLLADRGPMTDRQVQKALGFAEKNSVSPALTLLVKAGILAEAGKAVCDYTGRTVRTVGIPERKET